MSLIFAFSSQVGTESAALSDSIGNLIKVIFPVLDNLTTEQYMGAMYIITFLVRKTAHFSIYAILSMLVMMFLRTTKLKLNKQVIIAFLFTVLYAISDEIHQLFVPGRDGKLYDVCVDAIGAAIGIIILISIILPFYRIIKSKLCVSKEK